MKVESESMGVFSGRENGMCKGRKTQRNRVDSYHKEANEA